MTAEPGECDERRRGVRSERRRPGDPDAGRTECDRAAPTGTAEEQLGTGPPAHADASARAARNVTVRRQPGPPRNNSVPVLPLTPTPRCGRAGCGAARTSSQFGQWSGGEARVV